LLLLMIAVLFMSLNMFLLGAYYDNRVAV